MSLTADDGLHVFVNGEDVTDKVVVGPVHGPAGAGSLSFDISASHHMTVVNGDSIEFSWTYDEDGPTTVVVEPTVPLSGRWRVIGVGSSISADDWKIIDDFIIDSVVRGHARRL